MKPPHITLIIALSGLVVAGSGCGKKEEPKSESPKQAQPAATAVKPPPEKTTAAPAAAPAETATKAAEAVKEPAEKTTTAVKDETVATPPPGVAPPPPATPPPAATATIQVQTVIDAAQKLIASGNWQQASNSLAGLTGLKLTTDQQSLVDQLMQQIKQLAAGSGKLTNEVNKAIGNLLNK